MRIAMWSGPRNLSTALMYAFAARSDCAVWDEPFYGAFLAETGLEHPMQSEILANCEIDSSKVISRILGSIPGEKRYFYQKQMAHHMVSGFNRDWLGKVTNVFLIRHPARVIASYIRKREEPTFEDLGYAQLSQLYDVTKQMGPAPIVVDSVDIRRDPRSTLIALCEAIGMPFQEAMLSWQAGGNTADGVWAEHWYGAVHNSVGFSGAEGPLPEIPAKFHALLDQTLPYYTQLAESSLLKVPNG